MVNFVDKLGDWNPQLLRELKGRLKVFSVCTAIATSLIGQLLILLVQLSGIPNEKYPFYGEYCGLRASYEQQRIQLQGQYHELQNQFFIYSESTKFDVAKIQELRNKISQTHSQINEINGNFSQEFCPLDAIDMQKWWLDHYSSLFLILSVIFIFTLLVGGTYLLINDLAKEERRGTLTFIRLSPQTATSIFTGKLLGVPSLIYLLIATAVPLHFCAGIRSEIPLSYIFSFWAVLIASGILFYSTALLFSLCNSWLSGFQPWLGSGSLLVFLTITMHLSDLSDSYSNYVTSWLMLLSPFSSVVHLFPNLAHTYNNSGLGQLQWFYLPIGATKVGFVAFTLINYALFTFWVWQAIKRCFHNPNATILSKEQSYKLVFCFEAMIVGFAVQQVKGGNQWQNVVSANFVFLSFYNLVLVVALIAMLLPHRQAVQDWARYRHQDVSGRQGFWHKSLLQDLLKGEKSPALMAITINLFIATIPLLIGIVLLPIDNLNSDIFHTLDKTQLILAVALFFSLMMIYATIAQMIWMLKTSKRLVWVSVTVATMILPPIILLILGVRPNNNPLPWLFSTFPWVSIGYTETTTIFAALLGEFSVLALLMFRLTKQLRSAGDSATKVLLGSSVTQV